MLSEKATRRPEKDPECVVNLLLADGKYDAKVISR